MGILDRFRKREPEPAPLPQSPLEEMRVLVDKVNDLLPQLPYPYSLWMSWDNGPELIIRARQTAAAVRVYPK